MNKKTFLTTSFLTLVFFNISRVIGWKFFADTSLWTRIVNDNFHHWQLGILLVAMALLARKYVRWFYLVVALGIGMIIDESMYLFSPLYWRLNHTPWEGVVFEFVVFLIFALLLHRIRIKGLSR